MNLRRISVNSPPSKTQLRELSADAQQARRRLSAQAQSRPVFIEFSGMPRAGKTGCIAEVRKYLEQIGFHILAPAEGATQAPEHIKDLNLPAYNVWTMTYCLTKIIEASFAEHKREIVLLDRGPFDAICWFTFLEQQKELLPDERKVLTRFLRLRYPIGGKAIDLVLALVCDPSVALKREKQQRLEPKPGMYVTNLNALNRIRTIYTGNARCYGNDFGHAILVDTTRAKNIKASAYICTKLIVEHIKEAK